MTPIATKPPIENGKLSDTRSGEPPTSLPVERPKVYNDSWEGLIDDEGYEAEICEPLPLWREWE